MVLIDPKYNKTFNKIFGESTNKSITMKFIEDVTKVVLKDLVFVKTSTNVENDRESQGVVDVLCESQDGDKFLVEMRRSYWGGFANRLLYYGSNIYSGQVMTGNVDYSALKKVIVIAIINFPFEESYISCHQITNVESSNCRFDGLKFYLIDLTKFDAKIDQITTPTEVWCFYLKKIHLLDEDEINILEQTYPFIKPAVEELKKFHFFSVEEQQDYMLYCMNNDKSNTVEELIEDVTKEVTKQVTKQTLVETAKKLLEEGSPKDFICRVTGLEEKDFVE